MGTRIRVSPQGDLHLPEELRERLGWKTGSYLECRVEGSRLVLEIVDIDIFAEAAKKPDEDSFEKALRKQAEKKDRAFDVFEKKIQETPGEAPRPEDRPGFWD